MTRWVSHCFDFLPDLQFSIQLASISFAKRTLIVKDQHQNMKYVNRVNNCNYILKGALNSSLIKSMKIRKYPETDFGLSADNLLVPFRGLVGRMKNIMTLSSSTNQFNSLLRLLNRSLILNINVNKCLIVLLCVIDWLF